ncbi:MAG: AsmA family protein [Pseudomonadota bacterium]|nr:AsmA family protein [Pseudomonadota bacterium]
MAEFDSSTQTLANADVPEGAESDSDLRLDRPRNPLRWLWRIFAALVVLLFAAWLVLFITRGRFLKHPFERWASAQLQRPVTVGGDFNLYFNPIDVAFLAENISIPNPPWTHTPQFFTAKRVALRMRTFPLLFGKREMAWLDLNSSHVDAEWDAHRRRNSWTFGNPNQPGHPLHLPDIEHATIAGTTADYRDPSMQLIAHAAIDTVQARDTRFARDIRFTGTGSLRAKPVSFTGRILDPNQAVLAGGQSNIVFHANAPRTVIDVNGVMPGVTNFDGSQLHTAARGADMADLFSLIGVSSIRTRAYHVTAHLTYTGAEWEFTNLVGMFGDSDLTGRLTVKMPRDRVLLTADVTTRVLDILDAAPFIGYDPDRLDAMGTKGMVRQVGGHPRIIPDIPIPVGSLGQFDANVHYHVGAIRAKDFPVSNIDATLDLDHSVLRLRPARANLSGGTLTGEALLDGRHSPPLTEFDVRLSPTPMGKLLGRFGVADSGTSGTLEGRMHMVGHGASLSQSLASGNGRIVAIMPSGTLWERNVKLSELNLGTFVQKMFEQKLKAPVEMNCGLVAFTVRNGIADADPILIDTKKSVITGNGGFSFRDEALNLSIRAKSKTFSLFSLQSPVGVNGYLAAPGINVLSKQLLTRAGVAVAAGVVLGPFAPFAAFVDLGNAKAAACGPVLSGASAAQQRTNKGDARKDVGKPAAQMIKKPRKKVLGIF